ncbi:MBL fold metallo-hydrolase [Spirosoma montaniterrae]|uniref:MBL fold metallo-hydrolase n=1 Tax=Spirosoma montaniterrae TaxID=1178516 RepID=A0A1P9WUL0_9BACT|nr:MBL fold metallo-hydrolase [Spirosoma montaniterrae]AQG79075.1 MBL fold metallo-hydrolase [Spirosoma montaniterrae]
MSLSIASLNSGSNGNCYYIGNEHEAVLIDAGISCRETERRMARLKLSMDMVKAIFISHEHTDHVRGVAILAKKYQLPVFITRQTLQRTGLSPERLQLRPLNAYQPVSIGELSVLAFPKRHDAVDPHSFVISCRGATVGVFTDIGQPCDHLTRHFQQCHAVFLEANYDEQMLEQGRYPFFLKQRIRGGDGHLSNQQALTLFRDYRPASMSHVLLSHLSKDNNCPQLVLEQFAPHQQNTTVVVASRFEETEVYTINPNLPIGLQLREPALLTAV